MHKTPFSGLLILLFTVFFYACNNAPSVNFEEINDTDIARFTINNPTDRDIDSFKVELTYLSEKGEILKVDSVNFSVGNQPEKPFIKANEETFIVQKVPPGTTSARGKLINVEYVK